MAETTTADKAKNKVRLRIIETSDVHGSFFPFDFITGKPRKRLFGKSYYLC